MGTINSSEISIVVQGPVDPKNKHSTEKGVTYDCLKALKELFPDAEIVLSTWKNSNINDLIYDKIVLNDDPGGHPFTAINATTGKPARGLNNLNRLIVSTSNGLKACTRKYCLKVRSDILFKSKNFLKYFDKFEKRTDEFALFEHKIIACSYFSYRFFKKDKKFMFTPFHVSDWVYFGLTKDLRLLYDVPLPSEPDFSQYYLSNPRPTNRTDFFMECYWRFPPEQYIFINALKTKFKNFKCDNITDTNSTNIKQSDYALINNFIFIEPVLWKFIMIKEGEHHKFTKNPSSLPALIWPGMYRYTFFQKSYNKMFGIKAIVIPQVYEIYRDIGNRIIKIIQPILRLFKTTN